jgi:hypothetical protein
MEIRLDPEDVSELLLEVDERVYSLRDLEDVVGRLADRLEEAGRVAGVAVGIHEHDDGPRLFELEESRVGDPDET